MSVACNTYEGFLSNVYKYVTGSENYNNNIIKKHNKNLEKVGEFSFSFDTPNLCTRNIQNGKFESTDLVCKSRIWQLQISKCVILDRVCHIFIDRHSTYAAALQQVLMEGDKYGFHRFDFVERISLTCDFKEHDMANLNVTQLRTFLAKEVCLRLLNFSDMHENNEKRDVITFSVRQHKDIKTLLCGPVLSGTKGATVSADEFYKNRTTHMRLMAEHKYGIRVTSNPGWKEFFKKLGHAAVTFDLLQNKIHRSVTITLNDTNSSSSKGASFILYNCARLVQLFKEYDKKVLNNIYPSCPTSDSLNFNLLKEPEEWGLLFLYVLQFPNVVKMCIKDISECKINLNLLCNFLSNMCSMLSVYYRRIRILIEPRDHLIETLHCRMILLKAVQQVLHSGLYLLNIEHVKLM